MHFLVLFVTRTGAGEDLFSQVRIEGLEIGVIKLHVGKEMYHETQQTDFCATTHSKKTKHED